MRSQVGHCRPRVEEGDVTRPRGSSPREGRPSSFPVVETGSRVVWSRTRLATITTTVLRVVQGHGDDDDDAFSYDVIVVDVTEPRRKYLIRGQQVNGELIPLYSTRKELFLPIIIFFFLFFLLFFLFSFLFSFFFLFFRKTSGNSRLTEQSFDTKFVT